MEDKAKKFFPKDFSDRDRAIFETGIALASAYHQFLGIPIVKDRKQLRALERAIENAMKVQPYRKEARVKIIEDEVKGEKKDEYDYELLKGRHLDVSVVVEYGRYKVWGRMKYLKKIDYTLMYVEKIESTKD